MTSAQGTIPVGHEHAPGTISRRKIEGRRSGLLALLAALLAAMGVTAFGIYSGLSTEQQAATQPTISEEAIEAYGARWIARGEAHANAISPQALDAYAARWAARGDASENTISPAAIEAYAARWAARGGQAPQEISGKALLGTSLAIQKTAEGYSPEAIEAERARYEAAGQQHLENTNRAALESRAAELSPQAIEQRHALYETVGKQHLEKSQSVTFAALVPTADQEKSSLEVSPWDTRLRARTRPG